MSLLQKSSLSLLLVLTLIFVLSPNARLAFSIGTGIGIEPIQQKIESIQQRAIDGQIAETDLIFLSEFYRTLAYGAQATLILPLSSKLMHHYLDGSGNAVDVSEKHFLQSSPFAKRFEPIRREIAQICEVGLTRESERFDMGDGKPWDSHFALYFGRFSGTVIREDSKFFIEWSVLMPWKWPDYQDIKKTHGTYFKEIVPIPNLLSLAGVGEHLWLPNALGGEIENYGIAKRFNVTATWSDPINC